MEDGKFIQTVLWYNNYYKTRGEWKIQLKLKINFISSKYSDEIRTMRIKSNNIETMMGNEIDKIIK